MFRKRITKITVAALVLVLSLGTVVLPAVPTMAQGEALKIGLLSDQTANLKQYGKELEQGFALGLKYATDGKMEVAGRKLEVLVRDTGSKPDVGASQARELVEKDGAEILVGAPASPVALQVQGVAKDLDVILFAGPSASPNITGPNFNLNTFRVCRNTNQDFLALATILKDTGITKIVVLAIDTDFGRTGAAGAEAVYKPLGIEFAPSVFAPQETTDFTPYLQQVLASGANGLQIVWAGDTSVALFKQLGELGVLQKLTLITSFNSNPIVKAASSQGEIGGIGSIVYHYTLPKNEINDWLVENHKKDYNGEVPDLFTECGFASAQALVAGLTATEGDPSPAKMIPALEGLKFDGPRGAYEIRKSDHQALLPIFIARLTNVTDPDYKFFELVKEIPADQTAPPCLLEGDFKSRCDMK
jgi:branched-chain amino acid transport system substrate-binding protein